jgi:hypothetical protein
MEPPVSRWRPTLYQSIVIVVKCLLDLGLGMRRAPVRTTAAGSAVPPIT